MFKPHNEMKEVYEPLHITIRPINSEFQTTQSPQPPTGVNALNK
jgi:hypothetical protein